MKGIAAFLTVRQKDYNTIVAQYQNYVPATIYGHEFAPFNAGAITSNVSGGQQSFTIEFGLQAGIEQLVDDSGPNEYIFDCELKEFAPPPDGSIPSAGGTFARFIGELLSAVKTDSSITVEVGTSLDPVKAQAPPRKMTNTLVGEPPQI